MSQSCATADEPFLIESPMFGLALRRGAARARSRCVGSAREGDRAEGEGEKQPQSVWPRTRRAIHNLKRKLTYTLPPGGARLQRRGRPDGGQQERQQQRRRGPPPPPTSQPVFDGDHLVTDAMLRRLVREHCPFVIKQPSAPGAPRTASGRRPQPVGQQQPPAAAAADDPKVARASASASSAAGGASFYPQSVAAFIDSGGAGRVLLPPRQALPPKEQLRLLPLPPLRYAIPQAASSSVYVFWDVESKHPGSIDPRLVARRIVDIASCYGDVSGVYAYAVRKALNWVADAFFQLGALLDPQDQKQQQQRSRPAGGSGAAAADLLVSGASRATPLDALAAQRAGARRRNVADSTLGKVGLYHDSLGRASVPPAGYQISLKYVLAREGLQPRIVQNAGERADRSIAAAVDSVLERLQQEADYSRQHVFVFVSDAGAALARCMADCRALGCNTVAVCSRPRLFADTADAVVAWEPLSQGQYDSSRPAAV